MINTPPKKKTWKLNATLKKIKIKKFTVVIKFKKISLKLVNK